MVQYAFAFDTFSQAEAIAKTRAALFKAESREDKLPPHLPSYLGI